MCDAVKKNSLPDAPLTRRLEGMTRLPEVPARPGARRACRLKIWEMNSSFHCSIIGTCLSIRDLRKIAVKAKVAFPDDISDYSIHVAFVQSAGTASLPEKLMHKALERKHRTAIERCKRLRCVDDLRAYQPVDEVDPP